MTKPDMIVPITVGRAWFAQQMHRCIFICDELDRKQTIDRLKPLLTVLPPPEWGDDWAWNVSPDGKAIYLWNK